MVSRMGLLLRKIRFSVFPKAPVVALNKGSQAIVNILRRDSRSITTLARHERSQHERLEVGPFFINYVKVGHGPHVVFCFPGILGSFRIQVPHQILGFDRNKFTFITWDQPGYGFSRPPERVFTDDSLAEDADYLAKFMQKLGYRKYSLMGWSGGGCSALLFAINYPHLIDKLVVWGAFSYVHQEDADIFKWFSNTDNCAGKMKDILVEEYGEEFFKIHFKMWMELFQRIHTEHRGELCFKDLYKISAPTLILHGKKDGLVKVQQAETLRDRIPNARLQLWENARHNLHLRYPETFNDIVQRFLLE